MDQPLIERHKQIARPWVIAAVGVMVIGFLVVWALVRTDPTTGSVIEVQAGEIEESVTISVEAVPIADRVITSPSGGTIEQLVAAPGQLVSPGDVLLQLANPAIAADLMDAESKLAIARAELATEAGRLSEEVDGFQLDLDRTGLDLKVAQAQMDAEKKLQEAGISSRISLVRSQAEFEKQVMSTRQAERKLGRARSSITLRLQPKQALVHALEGRVSDLRQSREALTVRAPFRGLYAAQELKVGQTMAVGAVVAEVISRKTELRANIPAGYGDVVRVGQIIRLNGGQPAILTSVEPVVRDGMLAGRARLKEGADSLANGTTYNAELVIANHGNGTYVKVSRPSRANETVEMTVVDGAGRRRRQAVTFGPQYGNVLVLERGAKKGERLHGI